MPRRPHAGITIAKIAGACNVSLATVSRVLYNRPYVSDEVRKRIQQEIARSGYVSPQISRSGKVLLLSSFGSRMINGEYYYELLNALHAAFLQVGYKTVAGESSILPQLRNVGFDAVVSLCGYEEDVFLHWEKHLVTPLIYINRHIPKPHCNCYSVCADHRGALQEAVQLLYEKKHRRIGLMIVGYESPEYHRPWEEREGFLSQMANLGIFDQAYIEYTQDQEPHQALIRLLHHNITALICPSSTEGGKLPKILHDLHWKIPQDLSLIVGDSSFYNQVNPVELTSLRMPFEKIAENCCAILQKKKVNHMIPYELIQRESVRTYR